MQPFRKIVLYRTPNRSTMKIAYRSVSAMFTPRVFLYGTVLSLAATMGIYSLPAQTPASAPPTTDGVNQVPPVAEKPDPTKRRLTDQEKMRQQKALRGELHGEYKKWVDEDVRWIITDQELQAFKNLSNDEERDTFIENFWLRRNPNPDSPENEYREEHYQRIAYANEHYAAGKPGWKTDRGTYLYCLRQT